MAILKNAKLIVDGVTLTGVRRVAFNYGAETVDDSEFGDDTRSNAGGLFTWSIEGEANQSYGTDGADAAFATNVGQSVTVTLRHTSTATSLATSNPKWSGSGVIDSYEPMSGAVGDQHIASFSIVPGGTLSRTVAT